jgi:protein involved in polysaccharide export with SLBB domain
MRHPSAAFVLCLTLALAAAGRAQTGNVSAGAQDYTLRPGDFVRIDVWGQEAFSGQFQVDEQGQLLYPVIGEIDTRDRTVRELRTRIRSGLEEIFNQPFVTITPMFRIAVIGRVQQPGLLSVDPTLTVLDLVAMAGGPTADGNIDDIQLLRGESELSLSFQRGRTLQDIGIRSGDQILVPGKAITRDVLFAIIQLVQVGLSVAILINTF